MTFKPLELQNATGSVIVLCAQEPWEITAIPTTNNDNTLQRFNKSDFMIIHFFRASSSQSACYPTQ